MTISEVASIRSYEISAAYQTSVRKTTQSVSNTEIQTKHADNVEISSQARVKSLKQQGYSSAVIASQMGLNDKTVQQYLGVLETVSTYSKTKTSSSNSEITGAAEARSLKQGGYSASMIANQMGLGVKTVNQYLGTSESSKSSTFVQPEKLYSEQTLTGSAEAKSLKQGGYSVAMIAAQMGLSVAVVKEYLGIS